MPTPIPTRHFVASWLKLSTESVSSGHKAVLPTALGVLTKLTLLRRRLQSVSIILQPNRYCALPGNTQPGAACTVQLYEVRSTARATSFIVALEASEPASRYIVASWSERDLRDLCFKAEIVGCRKFALPQAQRKKSLLRVISTPDPSTGMSAFGF